jgi:hypothetical protein
MTTAATGGQASDLPPDILERLSICVSPNRRDKGAGVLAMVLELA